MTIDCEKKTESINPWIFMTTAHVDTWHVVQ